VVLCALGAIFAQSGSPAKGATVPTAIPFFDSFDVGGTGELVVAGTAWQTNGSGTATVLTNTAAVAATGQGIQMCTVNDLDLTLNVDYTAKTYTNVYWKFFVIPTFYDDSTEAPTNFSNVAAAFYVNTNGTLRAYAYSGGSNGWVDLAGPAIPSNRWIGFLVNLNYGASNYSISVTTNGYGSAMTLMGGTNVMPAGAMNELRDVVVCNNFSIDAVSLFLPASAAGGVGLPFADGFERYNRGPLTTLVWSVTGDGATATVTNSPYREGVQACTLSSASLTLNIDENLGTYSNIWCQMYIKPEGYDDAGGSTAPTVPDGVAAAVYVATNGYLKAYIFNGLSNYWASVTNVSTSLWVGVAMHLDYVNHAWDLYYTTNSTYGSPMTKANATAYWMQTNASTVDTISEILIQDNGTLDAVAVSEGSTAVTNSTGSATNMLSMELSGGRTNLLGILAHHYGPGQDTLAGSLGLDLKGGFAQGDRIAFYCTNGPSVGGWNIYTLSGNAWAKGQIDAISPDSLHITPGMGMKVMRANPTNAVVFYPYDIASNISAIIYGTNATYGMSGWNLLSWPFPGSQSASVSGWGFTNWAGHGDSIYLYDNGFFGVVLWYDHVAHQWMQGRNASSYTMTKGQAFWYYRKGTNTIWTLQNPSP